MGIHQHVRGASFDAGEPFDRRLIRGRRRLDRLIRRGEREWDLERVPVRSRDFVQQLGTIGVSIREQTGRVGE